MTNWYSVETSDEQERLVAAWPDAPIENLEVCDLILTTAREQVTAYGPTLTEELVVEDGYITNQTVIPKRFVEAQRQLASIIWEAAQRSGDGEIGAEGFTYTPSTMDKKIREIIRPRDVKPDVY